MIRLSVISGPDAGKRAVFTGDRVSIGRGPSNDFALRDGLVSQSHGEISRVADQLVYRDMKSRHGTLVRLNETTVNLHDRASRQQIKLTDESHIIIGETLVQIEAQSPKDKVATTVSSSGLIDPGNSSSGAGERVVTRANESLDAVTRRLITKDPRLVNIFKLSRSLNTVTELNGILELIVETTFDAFPAANFFAISVPHDRPSQAPADEPLRPMLVRERGKAPDLSISHTLLSHTLLRQVYESQESVLFVRDNSGIQPTQSIINARIAACMAAPLVGQKDLLGVMQVDTRGMGGLFAPDDLDLFTVLASYTAFAIERVNLTQNIYEMFEGVVRLSVRAIDARDPSTAGHSERVAAFTLRLAEKAHASEAPGLAEIRFEPDEFKELRYAALLHDFGKIGVRESVLMKGTRLGPERLEAVLERFEAARANVRVDAYRLGFDRARRMGWSLSQAQEYAEQVAHKRIGELNIAEELIIDNQTGRPLTPDAEARLRALGDLTFTSSSGRIRPLLLPDEVEDMTVQRGTLNEREWDDMRSHAIRSEELLEQIPWGEDLKRIPRFAGLHHEKLDGSGYPRGARAEDIPLQVRILTIADIFDAMTAADRAYRRAASVDRAVQVLLTEARNGLLDTHLVAIFTSEVVPELVAEQLVGAASISS